MNHTQSGVPLGSRRAEPFIRKLINAEWSHMVAIDKAVLGGTTSTCTQLIVLAMAL